MLAAVCAVFSQNAEPVKQQDSVAHYERYCGSQLVVSGQVVSGQEMTAMYLPGVPPDSGTREGMLITLAEAVS